ncbi:MAG: hypothetical protein ACLPH3_18205 [Terracidiphilus sp.]
MKSASALALLYLVLSVQPLEAAAPKPETLRAWDAYIRIVNQNVAKSAAGDSQFLWIDESQDVARRVHGNEVVVTSHDPEGVPQGMIHDWVGVVFVPDATLDQALNVVENYDRYGEFYKPLVRKCTILARDEDQVKLNVVATQKVLSVTAAVETEEQVHVVRLDPKRAFITSSAVRVREIADYGQPNEHPFPENRRPGFVWREVTVQRLEERDGGVYVELETVLLSRGIPAELRWLIKPLADELPRRLMFGVLNDTRSAVLQEARFSPSQGLASTASR